MQNTKRKQGISKEGLTLQTISGPSNIRTLRIFVGWYALTSKPLTSENKGAESFEDDAITTTAEIELQLETQEAAETRGKRRRKPTTRYEGFWRHRDDQESDDKEVF
jgi:hypothetical protein